MASQKRFGYKWKKIQKIPDDQKIQFNRWINKDNLSFLKNKTVLDAGCGIGSNSKICLDNGAFHVTCIDAYQDTLNLATKNLSMFSDKVKTVKYLDLERLYYLEQF